MLFLQDDDEEDSGTKDENESIMEDDTTEDIVDEGNVSGSDEGNNLYTYLISRDKMTKNKSDIIG